MKSWIVCFFTMCIGFHYPLLMIKYHPFEGEKMIAKLGFALFFSLISIILVGLFGLLFDWLGNSGKILGYLMGLLIAILVHNFVLYMMIT